MMISLIKKGSIVGLLGGLLATVGIMAAPVYAAGTESITLSPVSQHYDFDAGSEKIDSLKIINNGDTAYDFIVYARPYTIVNSDYLNPNYGDEANKKANADVYKWVEFDKDKYHIEPGQTIEVQYRLKVPDNAAPGGHYGVLFAETQTEPGQMIGRNKRVGSVLYATVKGEYTTGAEISKPSAGFFQINPPMTANVSVKNTGNASFITETNFRVLDIFGGEKFVREVEYDVLPDTTRAIDLVWDKSPSFGLFKVKVAASALDKTASTESYVFMAPFWFYGFVAILVIGGVMYAVARRKR